ncbi:MAG TPA: PilZ domain-containing protein [Verrucomicrobiae bacterium]|jgi:Tfp pilus assembly protein PilZ|nr:PilZ domain-containing protein [Verrucomicrobiae bacterium]
MWDGFDQRKFPRMNLHCEIQIRSDEEGVPLSSMTENVGVGGVAVILNRSLERFSRCMVRLDLGSKKEVIECKGKVVWIVPVGNSRNRKVRYDVGIEFEDMDTDNQNLLKKQIESFAKKNVP